MKLGRPRQGDSADMAFIEFVDRQVVSFSSPLLYLESNRDVLTTSHRDGELRKARPPVNRYPTPAPSSVVMAAVRAQQENVSAAK